MIMHADSPLDDDETEEFLDNLRDISEEEIMDDALNTISNQTHEELYNALPAEYKEAVQELGLDTLAERALRFAEEKESKKWEQGE